MAAKYVFGISENFVNKMKREGRLPSTQSDNQIALQYIGISGKQANYAYPIELEAETYSYALYNALAHEFFEQFVFDASMATIYHLAVLYAPKAAKNLLKNSDFYFDIDEVNIEKEVMQNITENFSSEEIKVKIEKVVTKRGCLVYLSEKIDDLAKIIEDPEDEAAVVILTNNGIDISFVVDIEYL